MTRPIPIEVRAPAPPPGFLVALLDLYGFTAITYNTLFRTIDRAHSEGLITYQEHAVAEAFISQCYMRVVSLARVL
jgi:hypothetical protein